MFDSGENMNNKKSFKKILVRLKMFSYIKKEMQNLQFFRPDSCRMQKNIIT